MGLFGQDSFSGQTISQYRVVEKHQQKQRYIGLKEFQIDGIVPVIPTPFGPEEEIDWAALRSLLDFAAGADLNAVCLPAYASEFYKLSNAERREVIVVAVDHLRNKVPVVAQVNYAATLHAVRSVREAQNDGASAICCAVPRLFSLDEGALLKHFDRILQAIDIPLIIQDFNPGCETVSVRFVAGLHRAHPHLRYVKLEEPLMAEKVEAILQETSGEVGVLEGWGGMFMLELIPAGISGVMSGLGISDILARIFRLAKHGDSGQAYELFQGVLPQIVFCLQNLELYHHAEKLLLEVRGIISGSLVRQASRTLSENEAKHIRFLNTKVLNLLDRYGFPRNFSEKTTMDPRKAQLRGTL
jgi:dihydrodipicolinate synthase/N-acetylneuraminate lyase